MAYRARAPLHSLKLAALLLGCGPATQPAVRIEPETYDPAERAREIKRYQQGHVAIVNPPPQEGER